MDGSREGESFLLQPDDRVIIGNAPSCNIVFDDQQLAPQHLEISGEDGGFRLRALAAGVRVNGSAEQDARLVPRDLICAGKLRLRFLELPEDGVSNPTSGTIELVEDGGVLVRSEFERRISEDELRFRQAERTSNQLQAIYEVGALLSAETDRTAILEGIVEKAMAVVSATRGFLILRDLKTGELAPATVRTPEEEDTGSLALSRTVLNECIDKGKSIVLRDALSGLNSASTGSSIFRHRIRSAVCVPLESKKQILGALYVDNTKASGAFEEDDVNLLTALGRMAGVALERAMLIERQDRLFYSVIQALVSSLEAKDEYTRGHTERVTRYALAIAREMELDTDQLQTLRLAGLLHDIGKIGIPEAILRKPGKLTAEEMQEMRRHPDIGADIVKNIEDIGEVVDIVRHHQEHWDGSGYPGGLKGTEIPLLDRVIAVADAYDAMTSSRAYRRNFSEVEVFEEFRRCAGKQFDPEVVEAFLRSYTNGTLVMISS